MKKRKILKIKSTDYQPSKDELEEEIHIPTTPEYLAKTILQNMKIETLQEPPK